MSMDNFTTSFTVFEKLQAGLASVIKGKDDTIKLLLTALLADGHILLEDYPGSGKTTLAKTLGGLIDCQESEHTKNGIKSFQRIQFTPDLLPGDVLGVNIYNPKNTSFEFQAGPVFSHIVLADEINRTGPKVQAAFLECMAEKQVTIDNKTYPLSPLFLVIGTQNPMDLAGTYPLPIVQLDRFLLKVPMTYVDAKTELSILENINQITSNLSELKPVCNKSEILTARALLDQVKINPIILEAIINLVQSSRGNPQLDFGLSTRSAIMMKHSLAAWALVNQRDYVTEQDFKYLAPFVLAHRLSTSASSEESQNSLNQLLEPIIDQLVKAGLKNI